MTRSIKHTTTVTPTPQQLAEVFWAMDDTEQAMFFNHLGDISAHKLAMQLQYVTDNETLHSSGRHVMSLIGDYAPKSVYL